MDRSYERLKKYEHDVEAHLQKVEHALDEEINNLKKKIRDVNEAVSRSRSQERNLERQLESANNESQKHEEAVQSLVSEGQKRNQRREQIDLEILGHEREIKRFEKHNDSLREELDHLSSDIREIESNLKALELAGEKKGHTFLENKMEENLEKLQQKKAAQDSAIRRLRKDARYVESALERVDDRILDEIRKHQSQTENLDRKVNIFTKEKTGAVDEFHNTLKHLNNEENGTVKAERKRKAVSHNNGLLYLVFKNDSEKMAMNTRKQKKETQRLEKNNSELKKKFDSVLADYEELKKTKADGVYRDFNPDTLATQEQKKLLKMRFSNREKEVDSLIASYNNSRNRIDRRHVLFEDGQIGDLKKELINAARRETALKARLTRLVEKNDELQEELSEKVKILEEAAAEVRKIGQNLPEKGLKYCNIHEDLEEIVVDTVTVNNDEDKLKTSLEKKEAELEEILEKLERSNEQDQRKLYELRDNLYSLNTKYQTAMTRGNPDKESEATDLRREIKNLKQTESNLNKSIAQLQREMQLSLIRREAAVGKAQSVVPLATNIRGERREELESLRRRVEEKRKELEKILVE